jgi:hypothetical protein
VIADSTFRFVGTYRFVSARSVSNYEQHLMVTRDTYEITVVTKEEHLGDVDVLDVNPDRWLLLAIDCASPFYCVGFISKISAVLSAAGMDILVVSTFSCDWVFVKEEHGPQAADLLRAQGFRDASA